MYSIAITHEPWRIIPIAIWTLTLPGTSLEIHPVLPSRQSRSKGQTETRNHVRIKQRKRATDVQNYFQAKILQRRAERKFQAVPAGPDSVQGDAQDEWDRWVWGAEGNAGDVGKQLSQFSGEISRFWYLYWIPIIFFFGKVVHGKNKTDVVPLWLKLGFFSWPRTIAMPNFSAIYPRYFRKNTSQPFGIPSWALVERKRKSREDSSFRQFDFWTRA